MTLSDIVSIIAIVVSIGSLIIQFIIEWKRNRKNRIRDLYNQAYKDVLMKEVPSAVLAIKLTKNGVIETGEFRELCVKLRQHSGFFKFYDERFYSEVVDDIMRIEDFVLDMDNHLYKQVEFDSRMRDLNVKIKGLYDKIMNKCL